MEGGQSGTYLRQQRTLSGPRVNVAKTYRDEMTSLYVLATLTCGLDDALVYLK